MQLLNRLRLNTAEVAAKMIDGEVIIMNLANGMYYSLDGVAGLLWSSFQDGYTVGDAARRIVQAYDISAAVAERDALALAGELVAENILSVHQDDGPHWHPNGSAVSESVYEPPALNRYGDMADLLALDPPLPGVVETPWSSGSAGAGSE